MHFAKILLVLMLSCLELSLKEIEKEKKFCYFLIYQIATTVNAVVIYKVSHTGLEIRRLIFFCFPPRFEMRIHNLFAPKKQHKVPRLWGCVY